MTKGRYVVGIDPDVKASGVALLDTETARLAIRQLPFAKAVEQVKEWYGTIHGEQGRDFIVIIEAGWLNKSNWHLRGNDSRSVAAAKGVAQGRNEQVSHLLGEMMEHEGIPYEFRKPLKKIWKGRDGKITTEELERITGQSLPRMNQEGRDAALLAWHVGGMPIAVNVELVNIFHNNKNRR